MDLTGQTALVTGGGRGIGRAISLELAAKGAAVVIADVDEDGLDATETEIGEAGGEALAVRTDLRDPENVDATVERALAAFESVEILVNNAGIEGPTRSVEEIDADEWDETLDVNLRGAFLACRAVLPSMKRRGYGRIVNIASVSGKRPVPRRAPYVASKAGLIGLTRTLAAEGGEHDINANAVCPGSVEGPRIERVFENEAAESGRSPDAVRAEAEGMSPRNELVRPEDVARMVSFLCSDDAARVTGQHLNVSAGKIMY